MPRWSWKQVVLAAVALLVLVSIGRALTGGFGGGAVDVTGQGGNPGSSPSPPKPSVDINGQQIPATPGPVAVLNPGMAKPGATIGVNGSGFDPGAAVDVLLSAAGGQPAPVASGEVDKDGAVHAEFAFPAAAASSGGAALVTVKQQQSDKEAKADLVAQAGAGLVKLSDNVGAPGATLTVDAAGFMPNEQIGVYWGAAAGTPAATMTANEHGEVSKEPVKVGLAAAGDTTLILVGEQSKTAAASPFTMLSLYPTAVSTPYAARAGEAIGITGGGFAPGEHILVHFDESTGISQLKLQADDTGAIPAGGGFRVPFGLTGKHTVILTGEQSRASVSSGFTALPYTPTARASTWGGLPGTQLNFYAKDFAPNEVVKVYTGADANNAGVLVAAFRVDQRGAASAQGSYVIPGDAQGELGFSLVGSKSQATATVTITVDKTDGPVNIPPQPKYILPPELSD